MNRVCVEDFGEILLFVGHGFGVGALKILRGMFERAVTAAYLHEHPETAQDFLDFQKVSLRGFAAAIRDTFPVGVLSGEQLENIEREYAEVKDRFMVTDCKKCGTKKINYTWNKLNMVAMAKGVGALGQLIVPGYYLPLRESHATATSIYSRLDRDEAKVEGRLVFNSTDQTWQADTALMSAHNIMLITISLEKEHFKISELEEPLHQCYQDFMDVWQGYKPSFEHSL